MVAGRREIRGAAQPPRLASLLTASRRPPGGAPAVVVKGAGHLVPHDQPLRALAMLDAFLGAPPGGETEGGGPRLRGARGGGAADGGTPGRKLGPGAGGEGGAGAGGRAGQ